MERHLKELKNKMNGDWINSRIKHCTIEYSGIPQKPTETTKSTSAPIGAWKCNYARHPVCM